jgi:hypothetical protein
MIDDLREILMVDEIANKVATRIQKFIVIESILIAFFLKPVAFSL